MKRKSITIYNSFHKTKLDVLAEVLADGRLSLSAGQVRRLRNMLCGMRRCLCGGHLGERAGEYYGSDYEIEPRQDGGAILTPRRKEPAND